jgi:uncharacterized membrane protein
MVIWNQLATLLNVALFPFLKKFGAIQVADKFEAKFNYVARVLVLSTYLSEISAFSNS